MRPGARTLRAREAWAAWAMCLPALGSIAAIAFLPLAWAGWESLHRHDLRMPWLGRPFAGLGNYAEALSDARFLAALGHTAGFAAVSVVLELGLGLLLALALDGARRGLARTAALLPWAMPTVVAALVWRFLFDGPTSAANEMVRALGLSDAPIVWLAEPWLAWVPIVLADVWKTTPFVALLLLAALQNVPAELVEAARCDGANAWQRFWHVRFPALRPALLVALIFRVLDAFRIFDLVYVLTGGGPGTATEPVALYAFTVLLGELRFGYGSALSMTIFLATFALAWLYVRSAGAELLERER